MDRKKLFIFYEIYTIIKANYNLTNFIYKWR